MTSNHPSPSLLAGDDANRRGSERSSFPTDVAGDIRSAASATDAASRRLHVERAVRRLGESGGPSDGQQHRRRIIEVAVFAEIAFAAEAIAD